MNQSNIDQVQQQQNLVPVGHHFLPWNWTSHHQTLWVGLLPFSAVIMHPSHRLGIKRWCYLTSVCLTSDVCLSRTSGLSREQRGLGRLKLAQRYPTSHVTRTPLSRSKGQRSACRGRGHFVAASRTACSGRYAAAPTQVGLQSWSRSLNGHSAVVLQSNGSRTAVDSQSNRSCNHRLNNGPRAACRAYPVVPLSLRSSNKQTPALRNLQD